MKLGATSAPHPEPKVWEAPGAAGTAASAPASRTARTAPAPRRCCFRVSVLASGFRVSKQICSIKVVRLSPRHATRKTTCHGATRRLSCCRLLLLHLGEAARGWRLCLPHPLSLSLSHTHAPSRSLSLSHTHARILHRLPMLDILRFSVCRPVPLTARAPILPPPPDPASCSHIQPTFALSRQSPPYPGRCVGGGGGSHLGLGRDDARGLRGLRRTLARGRGHREALGHVHHRRLSTRSHEVRRSSAMGDG